LLSDKNPDNKPPLFKNFIIVNKKITGICLAVILLAILTANFWRLNPEDPDAVRAVSIYTEILYNAEIVGDTFTSLTTTLGSYAAKRVSENPLTAALLVRLLKDAGVSADSVLAVNASGSFPGFALAALSASAALGLRTYVIASIGSSSYGANIPGNTIADMLLKDNVRNLGFTLLAVTPGGSNDRGRVLDPEELERISLLLEKHGIPFILPNDLIHAIDIRESFFNEAGSTLLLNIGGSHASSGDNLDIALMAGIIKPDRENRFDDPGLIQSFLRQNIPVIQILNIKQLLAAYDLDFDENGKLIGNTEKLLRYPRINKRSR